MEALLRGVVNSDESEILAEFGVIVAGVAELIDVLGLGNDQFGVGSVELLEDFGCGVERVGGGGDGTDHGSAHEGEDEFGAVLEEEHDYVAFLEAKVG